MDSVINYTENLVLSPSQRARLRTKDAVNKIKHGSPKLKEVLRQRCRARLKEKRYNIFNAGRSIESNVLSSVIYRELDNISEFDDLDEDQYTKLLENDEPMAEDEQYLVSELDRVIQGDLESLEQMVSSMLEKRVICPICFKAELTEQIVNGMTWCEECEVQLPAPKGLQDLEFRIQGVFGNHLEECSSKPVVVQVCDGTQNLVVMCYSCSYYRNLF